MSDYIEEASSVDAVDSKVRDEDFVAFLRSEDPEFFADFFDANLAVLARTLCDIIASGGSGFDDQIEELVDSGWSPETAKTYISASIVTYCPQFRGLID